MKLLLDEMVTPRLGRLLAGHQTSHVAKLGWRQITNGELLTLAESKGFDVLITKDSNVPYQQNLTGRRISVIVITPLDQARSSVLALAPGILQALATLQPGTVSHVAAPS